jgi:hypothetical protein
MNTEYKIKNLISYFERVIEDEDYNFMINKDGSINAGAIDYGEIEMYDNIFEEITEEKFFEDLKLINDTRFKFKYTSFKDFNTNWLLQNISCSVVNQKDICSIDLEEYDELIKTECGHLFKDKNLYSWIEEHNNNTCPLCRTKLF